MKKDDGWILKAKEEEKKNFNANKKLLHRIFSLLQFELMRIIFIPIFKAFLSIFLKAFLFLFGWKGISYANENVL